MDAIEHGSHLWEPVIAPSGTVHGLHCYRCGGNAAVRCPDCKGFMYGKLSDGSPYCVPCRKCAWCGKPRGLDRLSYCSDECSKAARLDRRRVRHGISK